MKLTEDDKKTISTITKVCLFVAAVLALWLVIVLIIYT